LKYIVEDCMTKWIKALLLAQTKRARVLQTVTKKVMLEWDYGKKLAVAATASSFFFVLTQCSVNTKVFHFGVLPVRQYKC